MTDTDLDLQSLGQILRQAREERALSLQEVEQQTRIRVKFLEALENGDLSVLPSPIHAKGFLRNYAQFLHLDADALAAQFGQLAGIGSSSPTTVTAPPAPSRAVPPRPPVAAPPVVSAPPTKAPGETGSATADSAARSMPPTRPVYISRDQQAGPATPVGLARPVPVSAPEATVPSGPPPAETGGRVRLLQSNLLVGAVLLVGFVVIVWWATTRLSTVSVEDLLPTPERSELLEQFAASATVEPSPTFPPTSTPAALAGPQILDRVVLIISVEQHSWTRIVVDGETVFEGQAEPGTVLQYEGRESILVRTGNGAGLVVTYNGQPLGPLGRRGEVVERLFTTGGQITPTYTPTVTPTNTSVPTPTPSATPQPSS